MIPIQDNDKKQGVFNCNINVLRANVSISHRIILSRKNLIYAWIINVLRANEFMLIRFILNTHDDDDDHHQNPDALTEGISLTLTNCPYHHCSWQVSQTVFIVLSDLFYTDLSLLVRPSLTPPLCKSPLQNVTFVFVPASSPVHSMSCWTMDKEIQN